MILATRGKIVAGCYLDFANAILNDESTVCPQTLELDSGVSNLSSFRAFVAPNWTQHSGFRKDVGRASDSASYYWRFYTRTLCLEAALCYTGYYSDLNHRTCNVELTTTTRPSS